MNMLSKLVPRTASHAELDAAMSIPPPMPTVPTPASSAVGAAVRAFDKSYQSLLAKRTALEAQIAGLQEDLRQSSVIISAIEAAMTVASADPALNDEEKATAEAAVSNRVALDAGDLSHG